MVFAVASLLTLESFAADKPAAQGAFDVGKQLMNDGHYAEACPKFEESLRLEQGVGTMLYLGACYEHLGRTASAWAEFREAEALATRLSDGRASTARERADKLESHLARLTVVVPAALRLLPELEVKRDDVLLGAGVYDTAIPVDPGSHRVSVAAKNKVPWSRTLEVAPSGPGARVSLPASLDDAPVAANVGAPTSAPASRPASETHSADGQAEPWSAQRIGAVVAGGAGLVALGVSLGFGAHAKSKLDESNADDHCRGDLCDAAGTDSRNSAESAATVSTAFFVGGLVALAGGAVLWFTAPRAKESTSQKSASSAKATVVPWVSSNARDGGLVFRTGF